MDLLEELKAVLRLVVENYVPDVDDVFGDEYETEIPIAMGTMRRARALLSRLEAEGGGDGRRRHRNSRASVLRSPIRHSVERSIGIREVRLPSVDARCP